MKNSSTLTIIVLVFTGFFLIGMIGKALFTSNYKLSTNRVAKELNSYNRFISIADLRQLMASKKEFILVDIRDSLEYKAGRLPNAVNMPISTLLSKEYADVRESEVPVKILYASAEADAVRALTLLLHEGYTDFIVLNGSYQIAKSSLFDAEDPSAWYSNDEKMRYNYKSLFKVGPSTETPHTAADEVIDISGKPRGGC